MRLRAAGAATVAALLIPIAGAAAADTPQRSSNAPPSTTIVASGSIAGSVTTAADGKTVSRARVILSSPSLDRSRVMVTGDDGRCAFGEVAAWRCDWFRRLDPHALSLTPGAADKGTMDLVAVAVDDVMPVTIR